jgi:DNA polymerase-3 subunit alpha
MSATPFVHLHVHTEYSLVDGIARVTPLGKAAAAAGMPALAVTEQDNLFSMVKFYRAAMAEGVKPIVGADVSFLDESAAGEPFRLVLLCQDLDGYRALCRLLSRAYTEGQVQGSPTLRRGWLAGETGRLIAISGGIEGDVGRALAAGRGALAREHLDAWRVLFPDRYYLEISRIGVPGEEAHLARSVDLAVRAGVPVVATNRVRFLSRGDFEAHEARVCIHQGRTLEDPRRPRTYTEQQYLRGGEEMAALFSDVPSAIDNAHEIARRCNIELQLGESFLPAFPTPPGEGVDSWLEREARRGLEARLAGNARTRGEFDEAARAPYEERLRTELDVINGMGFAGYFLIVADFIRWAREHGVPVGPGRGSGAGSLVAYVLGITDLDPIEHDLLFERFLNPERVSLPDFDVDFCMDGRDRVIDYVAERYAGGGPGDERVSQIITFGSMAAKAVVRDVGRVLGHPFGFVDQIAKLIPFELGITLDKALEDDALRQRYDEDEEVRAIIDLARKLEGIARNAGKHAGGVVIAPASLTQFTALYCEPDARGMVTQFDKDDVEAVGLVKFDFLGLRTLTIIDHAVRAINAGRARAGEQPLEVTELAMDDPAPYELIKRCATTAVFQLESRGMKDLIRRLQPDCFDDVVALVALFRPGPLQSGMVDDFIDRKHGRAEVAYPHPDLEPILKPTYGVILYQEQVMQIAQVLAGYTLGGADLLRRAMGKKKPEEMAEQREVFLEGATVRGVEPSKASYIFDLMEKFAGYGFNKSHSAAYAVLSFQTAWLKAHHPAAFMAAVLSADMDNTDKVVTLIDDCRELALEVLPPDVNRCDHHFTADDASTIRYGLGAVKGVGESAVSAVLAERTAGGAFRDLFDFCRRIDTRRANRRVIEALIKAGALDRLGPSRSALMASLTTALQIAEQHERDCDAGQDDMFGGAVATEQQVVATFAEAEDWPEEERLAGEKETLGLYLTGHPIARFALELERMTSARLVDLRPGEGNVATVAGLVVSLRTMNSRNGRMAVATLDDRTARVDVVVYSELYRDSRDLLAKDRVLVVEGEVNNDDFTGGCSIQATRLSDLEHAREQRARQVLVSVGADRAANGFVGDLAEALRPFVPGRTRVCLDYARPDASARLALGEGWCVKPTEELLKRLRSLVGADGVQVEY